MKNGEIFGPKMGVMDWSPQMVVVKSKGPKCPPKMAETIRLRICNNKLHRFMMDSWAFSGFCGCFSFFLLFNRRCFFFLRIHGHGKKTIKLPFQGEYFLDFFLSTQPANLRNLDFVVGISLLGWPRWEFSRPEMNQSEPSSDFFLEGERF